MLKYFFSEIRFWNDEWMNKWASPSSRGAIKVGDLEQSERDDVIGKKANPKPLMAFSSVELL